MKLVPVFIACCAASSSQAQPADPPPYPLNTPPPFTHLNRPHRANVSADYVCDGSPIHLSFTYAANRRIREAELRITAFTADERIANDVDLAHWNEWLEPIYEFRDYEVYCLRNEHYTIEFNGWGEQGRRRAIGVFWSNDRLGLLPRPQPSD